MMATETKENSDHEIPMIGTIPPQERKRYIRTRIIVTILLLISIILVITLTTILTADDDDGTDWQSLILSTTSAQGARNNSKYMTSFPHILGIKIYHS